MSRLKWLNTVANFFSKPSKHERAAELKNLENTKASSIFHNKEHSRSEVIRGAVQARSPQKKRRKKLR